MMERTAREGLEPSLHGPEPCVLPLDDRALTRVYLDALHFKYTLNRPSLPIFFKGLLHRYYGDRDIGEGIENIQEPDEDCRDYKDAQ